MSLFDDWDKEPNGRWIIWPDERFVSEDQLRSHFKDAVTDGDVELDKEDSDSMSLDEICIILEDIGFFTFKAIKPEPVN